VSPESSSHHSLTTGGELARGLGKVDIDERTQVTRRHILRPNDPTLEPGTTSPVVLSPVTSLMNMSPAPTRGRNSVRGSGESRWPMALNWNHPPNRESDQKTTEGCDPARPGQNEGKRKSWILENAIRCWSEPSEPMRNRARRPASPCALSTIAAPSGAHAGFEDSPLLFGQLTKVRAVRVHGVN
jgi:hypothetical protein